MSTNAAVARAVIVTRSHEEDRAHRIRMIVGYCLAIALVLGLAVYGANYYTLGAADRPFSPKHVLLKPSGSIGIKLGFLGFVIFFTIFLYPLRKRWSWLGKLGQTKHWLDIHVLLGLTAPFVIAFHSAFKFRGFAGIAFWIMVAVSASGIVGRYLYSQVPRRVNAAELSIKELQEMQAKLAQELEAQRLLPQQDLRSLLRLPSQEAANKMFILIALPYMMVLDAVRVFRIAALRRHALGFAEKVTTLGGFLKTGHRDLERAIAMAREEATTAKRMLFLSRSQQVFHLWHVVHKPFSYTFAILALIHIGVVLSLGFM